MSDVSPSAREDVSKATPNAGSASQIPPELSAEIRRLAHDLSNSLEIIVQTSYLLSLAELKPPADEWLRMLDGGVTKTLELNGELREYIRQHAAK